MPPTNAQPTAPSLRPGDTLDKFTIVEQIGAGGMSVVWKAHDRLLNTFVAVKQILAAPADADCADAFREKFLAEARLQKAAAENHKHLVRLIDIVEEPRGLFLVLEYVDGPSLEQILAQNRKPMDLRQAMGIIGATALALDAIHSKGILHRDLKPSNILLPRAGGLKIADFGLASLITEQESLSHGSARYMAPELFADTTADPRADLYSLGMIAYEALAGRDVFDEAFRIVLRDQRNQSMRWMKWHTSSRALATPLDKLNPAIPSNVAGLVARLMEKDRGKRVASAHDLLEAMQRILSRGAEELKPHDTAPVHNGRTVAPTAPLPKRSKVAYILAAILCCQIAVGVFGWIWWSHQQATKATQTQLDAAKVEFEQARSYYNDADKIMIAAGEDAAPEVVAKARAGFEKALEIFKRLATQWPDGSNLRRDSLARAHISQAQVELILRRSEVALLSLNAAEETGVFRENPEVVDRLRREAQRRVVFEKTIADIDALIANGDLGLARSRITEEQNRANRSRRELDILADLGTKLEDQLTRAAVNRVIDGARKLVDEGKRSEAITSLTAAQRTYRSTDLQKYLDELQLAEQVDRHLAAAEIALAAGRLMEAADAFDRAAALRPAADLATRAATLRSETMLQEGRRLLSAGNTAGARRAFTRALGYQDTEEARKELAKIESGAQKDTFIEEGDRAVEAGDFESAVNHYENAEKLGSNDVIAGKIADAKVRLAIRTGRDLLEKGQLAEAKAAFERAKELKPDSRPAQYGLGEVTKRQGYLQNLEEGDTMRRESRFGEAKKAYLRARQIWDTDEIKQRLNSAEFDHLIAQARQFISRENWSGAKGVLSAAAQMGTSDELKKLQAEVASHETTVD